MNIQKICPKQKEKLIGQAQSNPRLRSHHNFHPKLDDPINRLCITLSKGTYIRPHQHTHSSKWELILALQGKIGVLLYDQDGIVVDHFELSQEQVSAFEMPPSTWHSLYAITDTAMFFEVKPGPFMPSQPHEFATWSPAEGQQGVDKFLSWSKQAKIGDHYRQTDQD